MNKGISKMSNTSTGKKIGNGIIQKTKGGFQIDKYPVMKSKTIDNMIESDPERVEAAKRFMQLCIDNAEDMSECDTALNLYRVHYTKEMAELSMRNNIGNRNIKQSNITKLVNSIKCNEWHYNPNPMLFYDNGRLLSAQHRDIAMIYALKEGESVLVDVVFRKDRLSEDGLRQIDGGAPVTRAEYVRRLQTADSISGDARKCLDYIMQFYTSWGDKTINVLPDSALRGTHRLYINELATVLSTSRTKGKMFTPMISAIIFAAKGFGRVDDGVKLIQTVNKRLNNCTIPAEEDSKVSELLTKWIQEYRLRHGRKNGTGSVSGTEACLNWVEVGLMTAVEYFKGEPLTLAKLGRSKKQYNLTKDFDGKNIGLYLDAIKSEAAKNDREIFAHELRDCFSRIHC